MAQYRSQFMGTDPIENAEGAIELGGLDAPPPSAGPDNKLHDLNPQVDGQHDVADAASFSTNDDDVAGSPKGQGGSPASGSPLAPPLP